MKATSSATIDFSNTEIAFGSQSTLALRKAQLLFLSFGSPLLIGTGPKLVSAALRLRLPVTPIIKHTLFAQFCGGETIEDSRRTIDDLAKFGVGTILDYSVEGHHSEADFDRTTEELLRNVNEAAGNPKIPFAVFKMTGLGRFALLQKVSAGEELTSTETGEFARVHQRVERICAAGATKHVRIMIDAEESWIQDATDQLAEEMMSRFNHSDFIVYTTLQMYRHDRLDFFERAAKKAAGGGYRLGVKLVRGAYMEKERERARKLGYQSPINPDKAATDHSFDRALEFAVENIRHVAICAGTHNERSSKYLTELMEKHGVAPNDHRIAFAQLLGMSNHLSYNLAHHGYRVAKYVPYGPVRDVLPYLFRRAEENSSIKGQASRELQLIERELKRRAAAAK